MSQVSQKYGYFSHFLEAGRNFPEMQQITVEEINFGLIIKETKGKTHGERKKTVELYL